MGRCNSMYPAVMIGLVALLLGVAEAQTSTDCASKLTACLPYLSNSSTTTPPSSCCNPLKETVATELACLCNIYSSPGLLQGLGVNVTQALQLSRSCGVTTDLSNCNASAPNTAPVTPPATAGGDASKVACTGLSFLLLFWASMLFN